MSVLPSHAPQGPAANIEAESAILGAVLQQNALWPDVGSNLRSDDFYHAYHRPIFACMSRMAELGKPIDIITLIEELSRTGELEKAGGPGYIADLTSGVVPERRRIQQHVRIVRLYSEQRRFANDAGKLTQRALEPGVQLPQLAADASRLAESFTTVDALPPQFSEEALALRFSSTYTDSLRYVHGWGRWMIWDGTRWREDSTLDAFDKIRAICRRASTECDEKVGLRLASKVTVAAVERLSQADRRHAATTDQWDCDPWLLNTPAGTVDLRSGEIHGHNPSQYITKTTLAAPSGDCPRWRGFLEQVTAGDVELQSFLQRMTGYCLTGSIREHALFFIYGTGANGKSVFLCTIAGMLGDYGKTAPISTFTASNAEQHPTDLAGLRGARFVTAIETEDGRWWAEAKIKSLTGGDRIPARFMRQDFFEYTPQFKLVVAGNHKPGLRNVDEAIRRRLHLIPFTVTISESERDPDLGEKLKAEYPGILQWAIEGCLAWLHEGLNPPTSVRDATTDYLAGEDAIGRWFEDHCVTGGQYWTAGGTLFANFQQWCEQTGERPGAQKRFTQSLEARGFRQARTSNARSFTGIALQEAV